MTDARIQASVSAVPPGPWAVGVSGGADSVALLSLLRQREDVQLHVVHLDHQTRGEASTGDARFVADLAEVWGLPSVVALREQIEPKLHLHARRLVLPHPGGGKIDVTAPLPEHMRRTWELLGLDEGNAGHGWLLSGFGGDGFGRLPGCREESDSFRRKEK